MAEKNSAPEQQDISEILRVRREKLSALQSEGRDPFQETKFTVSRHAQEIKDQFDALEGTEVTIAGRLMSKRGMGKVSFCDLQDKSGRIQLYARKDEMDEEEYNRFRKFDIGDIVGVKGEVFRTQRGEMSVRAGTITLLSKSLLPLPEKFHGLTDKETRYRQRYVDLIVNPEVRRNFEVRSAFVKYLRRFLDERGYMEVETPVLNTISGGATARPFITHHNTLDIDMYMRIATELPLKRLIVGGMERVYEVGRIFRNEGMDTRHNPEFTTVELYEAYADFNDMMDLFEALLSGAARHLDALEFSYALYMTAAVVGPGLCAVYAIACATLVWSYLYNSRAVGLMHTLPVDRTCLFVTSVLSGLAMMLIPYAVVGALTCLIALVFGFFDFTAACFTVIAGADTSSFHTAIAPVRDSSQFR